MSTNRLRGGSESVPGNDYSPMHPSHVEGVHGCVSDRHKPGKAVMLIKRDKVGDCALALEYE